MTSIKTTYEASRSEIQGSFNEEDSTLLKPFEVPSTFNLNEDTVEVHFYDFNDRLLQSDYNFKEFGVSRDSFSSPTEINILTLNPEKDVQNRGFVGADIRVIYNFFKNYKKDSNSEYFIKEISPDRTEIKVGSLNTDENYLSSVFSEIIQEINESQYTEPFSINLFENRFYTIINALAFKQGNESVFALKLYNPLEDDISLKDELEIVKIKSNPAAFIVETKTISEKEKQPVLRGPNFDIEVFSNYSNPTEFLNNSNILLSITSSNYESYSSVNQKSSEVSVDYSDYSNFIHFSSAEERLRNFKYKFDLLGGYESSRSLADSITPLSKATASILYYDGLIEGLVGNFDGYERYLYFSSESKAWPKSNSTAPYVNYPSSNATAQAFFDAQLVTASLYDENNSNRLKNTIPQYLVDNTANEPYHLFIDMIGQHFDNLWLYSKGVSERYNNDNRLNYGISKELVGEALKSFGVKIYNSNSTLGDLFAMFSGEQYQTGSEDINFFITSSLTPIPKENYQAEVYKRIYHNLPLLLKSKGTERGLKALLCSFGIPTNLLNVRYYGGVNSESLPFYGPYLSYTSSLDRIRVDNTGSIVEGNTLSEGTSIISRDGKYTYDLHTVELGFSPSDYINTYIVSHSLVPGTYDLDSYIGDPGYFYSSSYTSLDRFALASMTGSFSRYNVYDLARLVKFYDNTLFKMAKDFIPARTNLSTGVIIKPHILDRSKVKRTFATGSHEYYSGSIDTAFVRGSTGASFAAGSTFYRTGFIYFVPLPSGSYGTRRSYTLEARYTGELSGSLITVSTGELNDENILKKNPKTGYSFRIRPLTEIPPDLGFSVTVTHVSP